MTFTPWTAKPHLHCPNQQRKRQQSSNTENFFQKLAGKTQIKASLNPGQGRTDQNQPPMRPQRANTREIHLGVSTYLSANPPAHLLTHPRCVGLLISSPLPLSRSGTRLRATDRTEKIVIRSDFLRSQSQQCLGTLQDCPFSSSIK